MSDSDDVFEESSDSDDKPTRSKKRTSNLTNNTRRKKAKRYDSEDEEDDDDLNHELKIYEETENKNKQREKQRLKQKYKQNMGENDYESDQNESDDDMDDIYLSHNTTTTTATTKRNEEKKQTNEMKKEVKTKQEDPPITLDELNKCRIPRTYLEQWLYEPYFDKVVTNAFVRLSIGTVKDTGETKYRLCIVENVSRNYNRSYRLGNRTTNVGLLLSYGDAKRVWSMDKISNSRITQTEYDKWIKMMRECKLHIMTSSEAREKAKSIIHTIKNTVHSAEVVNEMVKQIQSNFANVSNLASKRDELVALYNTAKLEGNAAQEEHIQSLLDELDSEAKRRKKNEYNRLTQGSLLKQINEKQQKSNKETLRRHQEEMEKRGEDIHDPSGRIDTIPTNIWAVSINKDEEEEKKEEEDKAKKVELPDLNKNDTPPPQQLVVSPTKAANDDNIVIDIPSISPINSANRTAPIQRLIEPPKLQGKKMGLEEYKKLKLQKNKT